MQQGGPAHWPLVAIVTPVYNGGQYLAKALQSVQAQTYPNLIHIVLNNASTDDSQSTIDAFAGSPVPIVAVANETTLPLHENWNKAFSYVPEEAVYAKLLCADDMMHPEAIARFVTLAESDPAVALVLSYDVFADQVRRANLPREQAVYDGRYILQQMLQGKLGWLAYHHFFVRVIPELRGQDFCGSDYSPDVHVMARSMTYGKFAYIPEPLLYNRYHADSVTGKEVSSGGIRTHVVPALMLQRFSDYAFDDAGRKRALDGYLQRMARVDLVLRATRRSRKAKDLRQALADHGLAISVFNYIRSVLSWPRDALERRRTKAMAGPSIDEASFMTSPLRNA